MTEDKAGTVRISRVDPCSPAAFCGKLALGDKIVSVDRKSCRGMRASEVIALMEGPQNTLLQVCVCHAIMVPMFDEFAPEFNVWLLRSGIGASDPALSEQHAQKEGCVGLVVSEGDDESVWHVDHVKVGGAAWLGASVHPMQKRIWGADETSCAIIAGDEIETVDGHSVLNLADAPSVMYGKCLTRVQLGIIRNGEPLFAHIVRSPVLEGTQVYVFTCVALRSLT